MIPYRWQVLLVRWFRVGVVLALLGAVGLFGAMEYTARPKFCSTCHIMKPYYESWSRSTHKHVPCTDCHYEPGLLETFEGKFKALSQVAKYITATAGTKPWAEVSDYSCMRPGCHEKRLLPGPIQFGRVRFDHRHHLTELRRGKKLRCTSCHSQVMVGSHMQVSKGVCFQCHFHPKGQTEPIGDCNKCHGPPRESIMVSGRPFRHLDFVGRGVACETCHAGVTQGTGYVSLDRCRTCHNEPSHLARIQDTEFLHAQHVTRHKVECYSCHAEIRHELRKRPPPKSRSCGRCHGASHGVQASFYAGTGAMGVEDTPSRMHETRIDCDGCHVCRPTGNATSEGPCGADEAACIHCHGRRYAGMKDRIQRSVAGRLARVRAAVRALRASPPGEAKPAGGAAALRRVQHNLAILEADGSQGMHNPGYAKRLLDEADRTLAQVARGAGRPAPAPSSQIRSKLACTEACHMGIEGQTIGYPGTRFSHRKHLGSGKVDCDACHSVRVHGLTRVRQCASCHHQDPKATCDRCHSEVAQLRSGVVDSVSKGTAKPDVMAEAVSCLDCHAQLSKGHRLAAVRTRCVSCHEESYGEVLDDWLEEAAGLRTELEVLIAHGMLWRAVCPLPAGQTDSALTRARRLLDRLRSASPVHNLDAARARVARAEADLRASWEDGACARARQRMARSGR